MNIYVLYANYLFWSNSSCANLERKYFIYYTSLDGHTWLSMIMFCIGISGILLLLCFLYVFSLIMSIVKLRINLLIEPHQIGDNPLIIHKRNTFIIHKKTKINELGSKIALIHRTGSHLVQMVETSHTSCPLCTKFYTSGQSIIVLPCQNEYYMYIYYLGIIFIKIVY